MHACCTRASTFPFLLLSNITLRGYTFYLHLSVDGHLDYFHFLSVLDTAAVNICVQVLCGHVSFLLGIYTYG